MAEFFFDYGLFALKAVTLVLALGAILLLVAGLVSRQTGDRPDELEVEKLNDRYEREREILGTAAFDDAAYRHHQKSKKSERKKEGKARKKELSKKTETEEASERARVFVLNFEGDLQAQAVTGLRRELTAVLSAAGENDEIIVKLESGGGLVHAYGLGASQLERVKQKGVKLTVCVDKVAASGGYMMACVADQLLAAPFAVIGSIGVVAQLPNFHRLLKKHDVDFELHTAGQFKRTLTVLGENTEEGRAKFKEELEETHLLFKEFVGGERPQLDIDKVATGEIWYGKQALQEKLIDGLSTSDDYIASRITDADVLEVRYVKKKSIQDKLSGAFEGAMARTALRFWGQASERPYAG